MRPEFDNRVKNSRAATTHFLPLILLAWIGEAGRRGWFGAVRSGSPTGSLPLLIEPDRTHLYHHPTFFLPHVPVTFAQA